jgi:hypothetical protein
MGNFEENLWADLLDEHGPALATAQSAARPTAKPGKRRVVLTTAGAFGTLAVAAALAVTFTATGVGTPQAYAVDLNPDGTVMVTFSQVEGVAGANRRLAELGVRAKAIVADPNCAVPIVVDGHTSVVGGPELPTHMPGGKFLIQPSTIPVGETLILVAEQINDNQIALSAARVDNPAPGCFPSQRR